MWIAGFVIKVCEALIAIPKIADIVKDVIAAVVGWYVQQQKAETLAAIADAAATAARANTQEERYAAAEKWQQALRRPRISA